MSGEVVAEQYRRRARRAGRVRRREPPEGGARPRASGAFTDEILPISIPQKKGAPIVVDRDEADPRRHDRRGARRAEAGVQERRHGHRRQRAGRERRRRRARRDGGRRARRARPDAARAHRRPGDQRPRAEVRADDAGRSRAAAGRRKSAGRLEDVDLFELNEAFAVQAVAVLRELGIDPRERQRPRRRRRARPCHRRQRRAHADDAALCAEAARTCSAASRRCAWAAATASRWPSNADAFKPGARHRRAPSVRTLRPHLPSAPSDRTFCPHLLHLYRSTI